MQSWRHWPRRLGLAALKLVSRDIKIRHHHTGDPLRLNLYTHKGYWYHGRHREATTMALCRQLIAPENTVYDIGGHIGYLTLFFAQLVGPAGRVHVFEPGENNLPYIERNIAGHANVTLVRKGAAAESGKATIYLESLAGQNNSLVPEFEGLSRNAAMADPRAVRVVAREIDVTTIDDYVAKTGAPPDFVKIDVEGFELEVLRGMARVLRRHRPIVMVEVQRNQAEVLALLKKAGYRAYSERGRRLQQKHAARLNGANVFALHAKAHAVQIDRCFTRPRAPSSAP
ncbi:MAG: FkbM family methyltransferase [Hyphomicrobiaceae bacterium]